MLWLLAMACRGPAGVDSQEDSTSGESPVESLVESPVDSDPGPIELELVRSDEEAYPGLILQEWRAAEFTAFDGEASSFLLLRTAEGSETGLLLLLHGSVAMDDGLQPSKCQRSDLVEARARMLEEWQVLPSQAASRGLAVMAPLNPWCDLWLGEGEEDPVDTGHKGYAFLELGLDWLETSDQHGLQLDGPRLVWGTSTGSIGAAQILARRTDFVAAVLDSGPVDFSDATQPSYIEAVDHVVGEDETRRALLDPVALARSGSLQGRVLQLGNAQDTVTSSTHLRALEEALDEGHSAGWMSWDLDHPAPSPTYHVQGGLRPMPFPYFSEVALDVLLEGEEAAWVQAESCSDCPVGKATTTAGWAESAHGGVVRLAEVADEGVLARFELPDEVPDEAPVQAQVVMGLPGEDVVPEGEMATLRWTVDGQEVASRVVMAHSLVGGELEEIQAHLEATTLGLPPRGQGGEVVLEVETHGGAVLLVDASLLRW